MSRKAEDTTDLEQAISESQEIIKVIPIRTESVLCHYPIHKLSKDKKPVEIKITTKGKRGKVETTWEVSANVKYGHPGELAYKLDTLVINRLVDEMRPDIPEVIKIADSLYELSQQLGKINTRDTNKIKNALYQNAFAAITARLEFTGNDNVQRTFEFGSTRYGIVFIGERLPDGRKADAIFIVLHPLYRDVLRHARTRPLDYAYLKELSPSSQRLYELIAPQIFAAIKNGNPRAKYLYSEFCQRSTLTQYHEWERAKKQLYKVHKPHFDSGYLKAVDFEETTDANGVVDWMMWYTPGRKAKAEFKRFNTKEGRELNKQERQGPQLVSAERLLLAASPSLPRVDADDPLIARRIERLIAAGLGRSAATDLAIEYSDESDRQLDALPSRNMSDKPNPVGWLRCAIREGYSTPAAPEEGSPAALAAEQAENAAKQANAEKSANCPFCKNSELRGMRNVRDGKNRKGWRDCTHNPEIETKYEIA